MAVEGDPHRPRSSPAGHARRSFSRGEEKELNGCRGDGVSFPTAGAYWAGGCNGSLKMAPVSSRVNRVFMLDSDLTPIYLIACDFRHGALAEAVDDAILFTATQYISFYASVPFGLWSNFELRWVFLTMAFEVNDIILASTLVTISH